METITKAATTYTPPATAVVHETSVSFTDRQVPPPVYIVQYDKTLPVLAVKLYSGNTLYNVPAGAAVNVRLRKPDGTVVYNPALGVNAARTVAYIAVTQQMTACAGDVEPVIEIVSGGDIVNSSPISMTIDPNPVTEDAVESSDEFKTVQELIQDAEAAAQAAATSATTATQKANSASSSAATASTAATNAGNSAATATSKAAAAATSATNAATSATTATQKASAAANSAASAAESAAAAEESAALAQQVAQGSVGYYETPAALRAAHATAEAGNWAIVGSTDTIWVWDTDTNAWVDTGQNVNLSDYYTKNQTDEKISSGNVASASKLTVPHEINGTPFDGTKDITTKYSYNYKIATVNSTTLNTIKLFEVGPNGYGVFLVNLGAQDYSALRGSWLISVDIRVGKKFDITELSYDPYGSNIPHFGYRTDGPFAIYVNLPQYSAYESTATAFSIYNITWTGDKQESIIAKPSGWTEIPVRVLQDAGGSVAAAKAFSLNTISNGTDYNTLKTPGLYEVKTSSAAVSMVNCPIGYAHSLQVISTGQGYRQIVRGYSPDKNIGETTWYRNILGGSYGAWMQYYTSSDPQPTVDKLTTPRTLTIGSTGKTFDGSANVAWTLDDIIGKNAGSHNSIFRGKYLGTAPTSDQYAAIAAGTFDDLFIGDYWTINGVNWRIAAFDYYLNCGDTNTTAHHAVIVPDTNLYNHAMNDTHITTGGYVGSKMYTEGLNNAKTTIKAAFNGHVLNHRIYLVSAITDGHPSAGVWRDSEVDLMNEQMVYGGAIFMPMANGSDAYTNYRVEKSQLPLFALDPSRICNRADYWLRDVVTASNFSLVNNYGNANSYSAGNSVGVRPAFCIKG